MIEVVHAVSVGKYDDPERNEDRVVVAEPFFAIVDGGTAKQTYTGESPGQDAARAVATAIAALRADATASEAVAAMSAAVAAIAEPDGEASAGVLMVSTYRSEVWVVGDGWVAIDGVPRLFGHEVERRHAAARAALLTAELERTPMEQLLRDDPGRAMILPSLQAEKLLANLDRDHPLCFGRIDGRPVPSRFIHVLPLAGNWRRVVLASDGYPELAIAFEETEAALRARIATDPLMIADPPATKGVGPGQVGFDDRSWLEIRRAE